MNQDRDEEIIDFLKKMPKVSDDSDKEILFKQIASRLDIEPPRKRKKYKIIPFIATAAALLFLASLPFLMNNDQTTTSTSYDMSGSEGQESSLMAKEESTQEIVQFDDMEEVEDSAIESESAADSEEVITNIENNRVIDTHSSDSQIAHFAIYDDQLQHVIPISMIVPEEANLTDYYNEMEQILYSNDLLPEDFILSGVKYQLDPLNNKVELSLPSKFTLGEGSARPWMFHQLLSEMFLPYGMNQVVFESAEGENVDLGPIGDVGELALHGDGHASFKIYQGEYYIRVPQEASTAIQQAIESLRVDDPEMNISNTIPEALDFTITELEKTLIFDLETYESLDDETATVMVESVLLTAGSYGFEGVKFQNMLVKERTGYDFTEVISVPIAVNPIKDKNK